MRYCRLLLSSGFRRRRDIPGITRTWHILRETRIISDSLPDDIRIRPEQRNAVLPACTPACHTRSGCPSCRPWRSGRAWRSGRSGRAGSSAGRTVIASRTRTVRRGAVLTGVRKTGIRVDTGRCRARYRRRRTRRCLLVRYQEHYCGYRRQPAQQVPFVFAYETFLFPACLVFRSFVLGFFGHNIVPGLLRKSPANWRTPPWS